MQGRVAGDNISIKCLLSTLRNSLKQMQFLSAFTLKLHFIFLIF